jgi:hypothetical protein
MMNKPKTEHEIITKHSIELSNRMLNTIKFYIKNNLEKESEHLVFKILSIANAGVYVDCMQAFIADPEARINQTKAQANHMINLAEDINKAHVG